jgi:hypothetical protein
MGDKTYHGGAETRRNAGLSQFTLKTAFRTAEILLLVIGGLLYLAAKFHFFTRYGSDNYVSEHGLFGLV